MKEKLEKYLRVRRPIIWCSNGDGIDIDDIIAKATKGRGSIYEYRPLGSIDFYSKEVDDEIKDLNTLINLISQDGFHEENIILIIKNAKEELEKPENLSYIGKLAEQTYNNPDYNFTTIVVSEDRNVPKEIAEFTTVLNFEAMNQKEIEEHILQFGDLHKVKVDKNDLGEVITHLKGLSKIEIDHILNMIIDGKESISLADKDTIVKEKMKIGKKSDMLELVDVKEKITDIGGLEEIKVYLESKSKLFRNIDKAKKFGVDLPNGILLTGMTGCGKSLIAKISARIFNLPLLKFDFRNILGKSIKEVEESLREVFKDSKRVGPAILLLEDIDKIFSKEKEILIKIFLELLKEKNEVFVIATTNNISEFPLEFLRKDGFDEIFFIDLPTEEEREKIFEIHLEKRGRKAKEYDCKKFAKNSEGYCGLDIERVINFALEKAFINGDSEIKTEDIVEGIKEIEPVNAVFRNQRLKQFAKEFKRKNRIEKIQKMESKNENMVFVQGGKYLPSFLNEDKEVVDLEVLKYPVTQEMWTELMGDNPSSFVGEKNPVENISWWKALEYCNKLSEKEGLKPVYDLVDGVVKINQIDKERSVYPEIADFSRTEGYRLPTEIEWEWFARGGEIAIQDGTFNTEYAGSDDSDEVAWHSENSEEKTHIVGTKKPNELGLYDCSGNVWEWCYDSMSKSEDENKKIKGGSWDDLDCYCEIKFVDYAEADAEYNCIGFRVVRTI